MWNILAGKAQNFFPGKHIKCCNNKKYCLDHVHLKKSQRGEEEGETVSDFSNMIFVPKPSNLQLEMTKALARMTWCSNQRKWMWKEERKAPQPLSGHSCLGRNNLSTLEYDPYFREVLSLTGTGITLSINSRLSLANAYGSLHFFSKLQQHCKSVYKMGLGREVLNLPQGIKSHICLTKNPAPDNNQYQIFWMKARITQ